MLSSEPTAEQTAGLKSPPPGSRVTPGVRVSPLGAASPPSSGFNECGDQPDLRAVAPAAGRLHPLNTARSTAHLAACESTRIADSEGPVADPNRSISGIPSRPGRRESGEPPFPAFPGDVEAIAGHLECAPHPGVRTFGAPRIERERARRRPIGPAGENEDQGSEAQKAGTPARGRRQERPPFQRGSPSTCRPPGYTANSRPCGCRRRSAR